MRPFFLLLLSCLATLRLAGQTSINLSHDLVPLGIADQNMVPNMPTLDSQPLFAAAIQYAQNNGVQLVTADSGAYYFLTSQNDFIYLFMAGLSDLTIDFQGSALYFKYGLLRGIELDDSQRVTLKNFTIDSLNPRITQVQLTSIDPVQGIITYAVPPGWADPASFTSSAFGTPQLYAAFFHKGVQVAGTGITTINYPISSPALSIVEQGEPWTQPSVLSTVKTGDTVAVWDRSGAEAVLVDRGDSVTLDNIEIHASSAFAMQVANSSNSVADNVRVKPRPGALIASSADGIHFSNSLRNNHIRNCYVSGTTDDALAMDSDFVASVLNQPQSRQLVMQRNFFNRITDGTSVNFVHLNNGAEVSGAIVVSQDPPDSPDVGFNSQLTFTFDRDLPALTAGDEMIFATPDMRGAGSTIEDNLVENIPVGRGMYLDGLENVVIQRNVIRGTSNAGINVWELTVPAGGGGLPSHGITIQDNVIENVLGPQASGAGGALVNQAAIIVDSNDLNFDFITEPVNSGISILSNFIAGSGRGAVWIGELNGGEVSNNVIVRWNQHPELQVDGDNPFPQDFAQPLVVRFSQGVTTGNNVTQMNSSLTGPVTLSRATPIGRAESLSGSIAVHVNVPNFSWKAVSDSDWLTITAGALGTGDGTIEYVEAANTTGSPRSGTITVAGVTFSLRQSAGIQRVR